MIAILDSIYCINDHGLANKSDVEYFGHINCNPSYLPLKIVFMPSLPHTPILIRSDLKINYHYITENVKYNNNLNDIF